jgi:hypothetical protein
MSWHFYASMLRAPSDFDEVLTLRVHAMNEKLGILAASL